MRTAPEPASYEDFLAAWDLIAPVGGIVSRDDETKAGMWKQIAEDATRLWTASNSVALVSLQRMAGSGRREAVVWHSAGDREAVADLLQHIEAWAASIGCERVTLAGAPEWVAKFPNYLVHAVAGIKDIRR